MIKGLGHIAIRAKDIEASAKFYRDVVGLKEAFRMNNPQGDALGCVYMYVAPSQFIEIFPNGTNGAAGSSGLQNDNNTVGLKHICIEVDNAAQFLEEIRARGAPIDTELKTGYSKCIQFWTHDPDGNAVEFMELPPESLQAQANERLSSFS